MLRKRTRCLVQQRPNLKNCVVDVPPSHRLSSNSLLLGLCVSVIDFRSPMCTATPAGRICQAPLTAVHVHSQLTGASRLPVTVRGNSRGGRVGCISSARVRPSSVRKGQNSRNEDAAALGKVRLGRLQEYSIGHLSVAFLCLLLHKPPLEFSCATAY